MDLASDRAGSTARRAVDGTLNAHCRSAQTPAGRTFTGGANEKAVSDGDRNGPLGTRMQPGKRTLH